MITKSCDIKSIYFGIYLPSRVVLFLKIVLESNPNF